MRHHLVMNCIVCVLALTVLTGCAGRETPPEVTLKAQQAATQEEVARPPKGNKPELIVALPADISGLNPMTSAGGLNDNCLILTHETLFVRKDNGGIDALLAQGGEWTSETTFEILLRTDVHFSDGGAMTAADVVHTFQKVKETPSAAPLLEDVLEVEALTDSRVVLQMTGRVSDIEERLCNIALSIQSKAAYETGMQNPYLIGTGRYAFVDRVNGRYTSFIRNEIYWGQEKGASNRISFYAIPEESTRVKAVQTGNADVALVAYGDALESLSDDTNVRIYEPSFSEYRIVYRNKVQIPSVREDGVQRWADVYVVLD